MSLEGWVEGTIRGGRRNMEWPALKWWRLESSLSSTFTRPITTSDTIVSAYPQKHLTSGPWRSLSRPGSVHRRVPFLEQVSKSTWLLSSDLSYQILASLGLHVSQLTFKMGDQIRPSSTSSATRISWVFEISGGNLVEHQLYFQRRKLNIN